MSDVEQRLMAGMILIEDKGTSMTLWSVSGVRATKTGVSATLRSYEGSRGGNVWASSEARATFPDGVIRAPFHLVTVLDVVKGKWPERVKPQPEAQAA